MNVKQLRQTAKAQYAQGKGRRDLKGYSRMGKAALLSKLGMHEEARAHKSQTTRRKAIAFNATKEGGDSSVKKAQIKGRILRSVKRGIGAEEKKQGRKLTQEEKRTVAARALASEVKAIRSGTPESKPKRGNGQAKGERSHPSQKESDQALTHKIKSTIASNPDIKLRELQAKVGYKSSAYGNLPDTNPLNHHLKKMVASGEVSSKGGGTFEGEPKFNVAPTAKRGIAAFKRKPEIEPKSLTPDQHKQVAIDVKRIKESDRQGWIADGMAKGDETMLRSQARQRMLNHSRSGLFQDFKSHEDAVVAAFKSKDPQPSKHSIEAANLEDKISANRKRAAKLQGELQEIVRDRKPMSMRHYNQDLIKNLDREHKSLTDQLSHLKPKDPTPTDPDVKEKQQKELDKLPSSVKDSLDAAIRPLRQTANEMDRARETDRSFGGGGRYESEVAGSSRSIKSSIAAAHITINKFKALAPKNGVNADRALQELGLPDVLKRLELSPGAKSWLNEPTVKHSVSTFKRKPKAEPVEQKIKLEDVKSPSDRAKYAKQEAAHQRSQGNEKAAKAWDDKAKEGRKAAISRDTIANTQSQTNLFGVTDHASDMPLFGGHQEEPAKKPESETKEPRGLQEVSPHDLHFDPKRFQYKLVHGETGASGSLTDVRKWDENLGGVMLVWRDPKDGKDYVVNGHNRNTLARKLGAEKVAVRYLPVDTPKEARVIGALANMSEGSGNALDAAKFLRDTGMNREQLEEKGIPMKQKVATDGLALSKLAPHLFDKVVQGDIPIERATLIGDRIHDHDNQAKLVDLIDKAQSKGRKITNDVVRELADTVQSAPSHTETQFDLFGASETTQNLALEKAELTAHVRSRLSREKKLFGLVSKSKAASELERGGNTIDTEKSKGISDQASQVLGVFDQLKNQSGPVSSAINKAVERIANGDNQKQVQDDLHKQLLTEIPQALGIRSRSDSDSVQATTGRSGEGQKRLRVKKS